MTDSKQTITAEIPIDLIADKLISRWSGWDEDEERELSLSLLVEQAVSRKLDKLINDQVHSMIDGQLTQKITPIIDQILEHGIAKTDSYGMPWHWGSKMEKTRTDRGFAHYTFKDRNETQCSLQESSIATEGCIWLGPDDADPKMFVPNGNPSWRPMPLPDLGPGETLLFTTRMHLTQEQARELIPLLTHFAETGLLP